jgi:pimeloyl-ACP methyl ester carboxylesterase
MVENIAGKILGKPREVGLTSGLQKFTGTLSYLNPFDDYSFTVNSRSSFNLSLSGLDANADVKLLNNRGEVLQTSTQLGTSSESLFISLNTGRYNIRVYSGTETTTNYNLSLSATPSMKDLEVDGISVRDDNDITFQVRGSTGKIVNLNQALDSTRDWQDRDLGRYVKAMTYETSTPITEPLTTNSNSVSDPNGTLFTATNWGAFNDKTESNLDAIGFSDDQNDFIRFSVTNNRTNVHLQLSDLSANADLQLIRDLNNNGSVDIGEVLAESLNPGTSVDFVSRIVDSGDYFIRVFPGVSSTGTNYSLSIRTANLAGQVRAGSENVNVWRYDTGGRTERNDGTYQGINPNQETVIVIHGWNNNDQSASIRELAKEASEFAPQVLALDWGSISQAGLDWGVVPFETAQWIAPVAQWAYERILDLGISANQLTLIGHSLGAHLSAEIGKLFNGVQNLVALDPAYPANNYDIDINQAGQQQPANFRDVATKSLAFVVADNNAGIAGDNEKAATAHDSFLMRFDASDRGFITPVGTHGAVIDAFTDALDRRFLTLPDLNLPNHFDDWYDNDGNRDNWWDRRFNPGRHEGTISAIWTGNKLNWDDGRNSWRITGLERVVYSSGTEQTTWTSVAA